MFNKNNTRYSELQFYIIHFCNLEYIVIYLCVLEKSKKSFKGEIEKYNCMAYYLLFNNCYWIVREILKIYILYKSLRG